MARSAWVGPIGNRPTPGGGGGGLTFRSRSGMGSDGGAVAAATNAAFPTQPVGRRVTWSTTLVFAADNVPVVVPAYRVPSGCTVRVRANNGQYAGNQAIAFVAADSSALLAGHGTPLAPLDDVAFPVDNTCRVQAMGKAGDGVVVSIVTLY